jgi:hypothetical protein
LQQTVVAAKVEEVSQERPKAYVLMSYLRGEIIGHGLTIGRPGYPTSASGYFFLDQTEGGALFVCY